MFFVKELVDNPDLMEMAVLGVDGHSLISQERSLESPVVAAPVIDNNEAITIDFNEYTSDDPAVVSAAVSRIEPVVALELLSMSSLPKLIACTMKEALLIRIKTVCWKALKELALAQSFVPLHQPPVSPARSSVTLLQLPPSPTTSSATSLQPPASLDKSSAA